jgi:hypothetical protein
MQKEDGVRRRRASADGEQLHGVTSVLFLNDGVTLATAGELCWPASHFFNKRLVQATQVIP